LKEKEKNMQIFFIFKDCRNCFLFLNFLLFKKNRFIYFNDGDHSFSYIVIRNIYTHLACLDPLHPIEYKLEDGQLLV